MQGFYSHEEEKGVLLSQMGVDPKEWLIEEGSVISVFRYLFNSYISRQFHGIYERQGEKEINVCPLELEDIHITTESNICFLCAGVDRG